jgi:hypothetical protein
MAEFRDDGLAEFGEHGGDDECWQWSEHERRVMRRSGPDPNPVRAVTGIRSVAALIG